MPPTVGWSACGFVAAVLARLIHKGLELLAELDEAAVGHLRPATEATVGLGGSSPPIHPRYMEPP